MRITVDLSHEDPIGHALRLAVPDTVSVVVGFAGATLLDAEEGWQEARFSPELADMSRRLGRYRAPKYVGYEVIELRSNLSMEFTVQVVRRGRGPRRTGKGRYPACG